MQKTFATVLLALTACSCAPVSAPFIIAHDPSEQRLAPDNSMIGPACNGIASDEGLKLSGHAWSYVDVTIVQRDGAGFKPYAEGAAPADFNVTTFPRPIYSTGTGALACSGLAMKTIIRRDGYEDTAGMHVDFDLEVAPTPGNGGTRLPADPTRVRGRFELTRGYGDGQVAFSAGGRELVATLHAHPGPEFRRAEVRSTSAAANPPESFAGRAKLLPDEQPGRTLDDVMINRRR